MQVIQYEKRGAEMPLTAQAAEAQNVLLDAIREWAEFMTENDVPVEAIFEN